MKKYSKGSIAMEYVDEIKVALIFVILAGSVTAFLYLPPVTTFGALFFSLITLMAIIYVARAPLNILFSSRAYRFSLINKIKNLQAERDSYRGIYRASNELGQSDKESFELAEKARLFVKEVDKHWRTTDNSNLMKELDNWDKKWEKRKDLTSKLQENVAKLFYQRDEQIDSEIEWLDQKIQDLANEGKQRLEDYVYSD